VGGLGAPFGARRGDCILERPVQNVPVQKDDGVEGLALRGGGDLPLGGEVGQKPFGVPGLELVGMGLAAEKALRERVGALVRGTAQPAGA